MEGMSADIVTLFERETWGRCAPSMRANAEPFAKDGGYAFPHTLLLGCARKA